MSAQAWPSNADLMVDVHKLFPLELVRDVTYGRGLWWAKHRPDKLSASDDRDGLQWKVAPDEFVCADFRHLPDASQSWPVVAFDPPYLPQTEAQLKTSTLQNDQGDSFQDRYGLVNGARNAQQLRHLIAHGLCESLRVVDFDGIVLLKCMAYVVGAEHRAQPAHAIHIAEAIGFKVAAQFIHIKGAGPQPSSNRNIASPRANYSQLIVLRAPKRPRLTKLTP